MDSCHYRLCAFQKIDFLTPIDTSQLPWARSWIWINYRMLKLPSIEKMMLIPNPQEFLRSEEPFPTDLECTSVFSYHGVLFYTSSTLSNCMVQAFINTTPTGRQCVLLFQFLIMTITIITKALTCLLSSACDHCLSGWLVGQSPKLNAYYSNLIFDGCNTPQ